MSILEISLYDVIVQSEDKVIIRLVLLYMEVLLFEGGNSSRRKQLFN